MVTLIWVTIVVAWRHQAITWTNVDLLSKVFSSIPLKATCSSGSPHKGSVMQTFNVFFVVCLNKLSNKQSSDQLNKLIWCHPNVCGFPQVNDLPVVTWACIIPTWLTAQWLCFQWMAFDRSNTRWPCLAIGIKLGQLHAVKMNSNGDTYEPICVTFCDCVQILGWNIYCWC